MTSYIAIIRGEPVSAPRENRLEIERLPFTEAGWQAASAAMLVYPLRAKTASGSPAPRYWAVLHDGTNSATAKPCGPWPGTVAAAMEWARHD